MAQTLEQALKQWLSKIGRRVRSGVAGSAMNDADAVPDTRGACADAPAICSSVENYNLVRERAQLRSLGAGAEDENRSEPEEQVQQQCRQN